MDAARTVLRQGSRHVTIYARGKAARASQREVDYALADGIAMSFGMSIVRFEDAGPVFIPHTFDEEGNVISDGEPELVPADSSIIAASQEAKDKLVNTTSGLDITDRGLMEVDENGQTTRPGIFSGGDVVSGPWNVVQAVKDAKHVAQGMMEYLEAKKSS